jgi:hypothetical protein
LSTEKFENGAFDDIMIESFRVANEVAAPAFLFLANASESNWSTTQ